MKTHISFICYCLLALFLSLPWFSLPLEASAPVHVIIVKEKGIKEFELAEKGIADALDKANINAEFTVFHLPGNAEGEENQERLEKYFIAPIKARKPRLIITIGAPSTQLIYRYIKDIPIIFSVVMDLGEFDPGKRLRGATVDIRPALRLKTLALVFPHLKRVGVIYNPGQNAEYIREAQQCAWDIGIQLTVYPVNSVRELPRIKDLKIDALWAIPDTVVLSRTAIARHLIMSCVKNNVALIAYSSHFAYAGALMSLACNYKDVGRQTGEIAAQFFKGKKYADLEVTSPRVLKLYFNQAVADRLNIKIPKKYRDKAAKIYGQ